MEAMNVRAVENHLREVENHVRDEQNSAEISKKSKVGIEDDECRSKELKHQCSNSKGKGDRYLCKQCDKGFKSPYAVFGHMRCHSNNNSKKNKAKSSEVPRKKRSFGRYKINPASSNTSWSYLTSSSLTLVSDDDDDDDKLEDIAVSLLMLANGGGGIPLSQSFSDDDDSVKLDYSACQQCHFGYRFPTVKQCGFYHIQPENVSVSVQSGSNFAVCFKDRNEESLTHVDIPTHLCDAEMWDGEAQVELVHTDLSLNLTCCASAAENPKSDVDIQSGHTTDEHLSELFDSEIKTADTIVDTLSPKSCHFPVEQRKVVDQASHKCDLGTETDGGPTITRDNICFKEYICRVCNRSYLSHQALGGHRLHCPRKKKFCRARAKSTNNSNNVAPQDGSNKKRRTHKCLVCCKAFSSGQALGGHMRAHFNANTA